MMLLRTYAPALALLLILALAALAYLPGLQGSFLFDDFGNLPALGAFGPVDDAATFWRYVTSGIADPTGRPIALLSFLLDAHDWPADPAPFKRTSLLLHLLNGVLLALLLRRLGRAWLSPILVDQRTDEKLRARVAWAAVLGASLWLLHPLFVSTTLYIVQREAMLPVTFTLLGLLAWLYGRAQSERGRWLAGALWCFAGLGGGTLLAALSKANGALLPLLALVIQWTLLPPWQAQAGVDAVAAQRGARSYAAVRVVAMWLPTAMLVSWLLYQGIPDILAESTHGRPWTTGQRLLTESRILVDYLRLLWVPHPYTSGLFNDQIVASRTLLDPPTTLLCTLLLLGLLVWGLVARKRYPMISAAILFYLGGQLLESTVLALELYFEHRNYLPALLLFWPLALWICGAPVRIEASKRELSALRVAPRVAIALMLVLGLAAMTYARADLWGNTHEQALLWARLNPNSPRAQAYAAQVKLANGHPALALPPLRRALASKPTEVQLALNLFAAECKLGAVTPATLEAARTALRTTEDPGTLLVHWFERAIGDAGASACPQADLAHVALLLHALGRNNALMERANRRQDLAYLQGRLALTQGQPDLALADFNWSIDQQVRPGAALRQAALLGASGYPELGLAHLAHYDAAATSGKVYEPPLGMARLHEWVLRQQGYWAREEARLRATLREDVRNKQLTTG